MECLDLRSRLDDYLDGRLSGNALQGVEAHLASGCSKCTADIEWYKSFKQIGAKTPAIDAPPWVLKRALRLFEARPGIQPVRDRVASAVAKLIYDSFKHPAPAGDRSAAPAERQLIYRVDDFSIDLQIAGSGSSGVVLTGQILDAGESGFDAVAEIPINLAHQGKQVHSTVTNDIGEFTIGGVDRGEYDLIIDTREMTLSIVGLEVISS